MSGSASRNRPRKMSKTIQSSNRAGGFPLVGAFLALLALFVFQAPAQADPLDGPRSAGIVGEQANGLAAIRDPARATAEIKALVNEINAKRQAFYKKKAKQEGASPSEIAKIYAKTIYEKAPSGYWFQSGGGWTQK